LGYKEGEVKTVKRISWILALIAVGTLFLLAFILYPTTSLFRALGQLSGAVGVGAIVFFIVYGVGSLVVRISK